MATTVNIPMKPHVDMADVNEWEKIVSVLQSPALSKVYGTAVTTSAAVDLTVGQGLAPVVMGRLRAGQGGSDGRPGPPCPPSIDRRSPRD